MSETMLVVDVQDGMLAHPRYSMYRTEQALERIRALIEAARATNTPVVYVQRDEKARRRSKAAKLLFPEIAPQEGDLVISSRFADSFDELLLRHKLESGSVRTLVVTGLNTEQCIDTACELTFDLDYDVTVVLDTYTFCGN